MNISSFFYVVSIVLVLCAYISPLQCQYENYLSSSQNDTDTCGIDTCKQKSATERHLMNVLNSIISYQMQRWTLFTQQNRFISVHFTNIK